MEGGVEGGGGLEVDGKDDVINHLVRDSALDRVARVWAGGIRCIMESILN